MRQDLYHWLYQMDLYREQFLNKAVINVAMLNVVKFYEMVHSNENRLVGPIDLHKLFIDPEDGHFQVEAGGARDSYVQDIDTIKFMPPEVINMETRWDLDADKFVLSEILFVLRYCKHPYDGRKVLEKPIADVNVARERYGNCKFVFDSKDSENSLDYNTDSVTINAWTDDNDEIKAVFTKVFTDGYNDKSYRLNDSDWKQLIR